MTRRELLGAAAAAVSSPAFAADKLPGPICLFSKHLPGLPPRELARALKPIGFGGIDLTVRPGGHILPGRVETDLPAAVAAIRAEGLEVPHITTALNSGDDPTAVPILKAAAKEKIPFFRIGYHLYKSDDVRAEVKRIGAEVASLAAVARAQGVQMLFQNHAGNFGAALWDMAQVLDPLDPRVAGVEFDVRHAVAEGGTSAWRTGFHLLAPRIRTVCIKDVYWKKGPKGWALQDCPLGEGMVNWPAYLKLLAKAGFRGPVLLHQEYVENGDKPGSESRVLPAVERDLKFLKAELARAYA